MNRSARATLLALPVLLVLGLLVPGATPAAAVTGADFRPGNIISDGVFFNSRTMTAENIQSFLRAKHPGCTSGYVCLPDYRVDTASRAADAQCGAYAGAQDELASRIIHKVARACGINPKVLLVLLQKETSLITKSNPTYLNAYRKATGYGCPDTAPCDAQYYGFYNQVYKAAWQYKRYTNNPDNYSYRSGRTNYIQWHPDSACGGSDVYIENRATAALYIYTPYQPNQAALTNLLGTGNSCSSYGNRNFWRLFNDWFGSTQTSYAVTGAIGNVFYAMGGSSGALGDAQGPQYATVGGGAAQAFQHGRIHWSPATGAHAVLHDLSRTYDAQGGERGPLGYPRGGRYPTAGSGWTQAFEHGRIHWSPTTGGHAVIGEMSVTFDRMRGEGGQLGYPVSGRRATVRGGFWQSFQHGSMHWSAATGAHAVLPPISGTYAALLGETGELGYPTRGRSSRPGGGWVQPFQGGRVHHSPGTGSHPVLGDMSRAYDELRGESGVLGYPLAGRRATAGGGWTQDFQHGRIHHHPAAGAHAVLPPVAATYYAAGAESGAFGYPVEDMHATSAGGAAQSFQHGVIVVSQSGAIRTVRGDVARAYVELNGARGELGEPVGAQRPVDGGILQDFQGGQVYDGPDTPAQAVTNPLLPLYQQAGAQAGQLSWPIGRATDAPGGAAVQRFLGGTLVVDGETVRRVVEPASGVWWAAGGPAGVLGMPTGDQQPAGTGGGAVQAFEHGVIVSRSSSAQAVAGDLAAAYQRLGGISGALGYPTSGVRTTAGDGRTQDFEHGRLQGAARSGVHAVLDPVRSAHDRLGGESGILGYPTSDRRATTGGGWAQRFQHGRVHWSPRTGAHAVHFPLRRAYDRLRGESGVLGYPVAGSRATARGGHTQAFQHGRIHWSRGNGAHAVLAPIRAVYDRRRGESGPLGYPVAAHVVSRAGVVRQSFENGTISVAPGRRPVVTFH